MLAGAGMMVLEGIYENILKKLVDFLYEAAIFHSS